MGRMFRIISEAAESQSAPHRIVPTPADPGSESSNPVGTVPFVEIGGPEGVVTSGLPSPDSDTRGNPIEIRSSVTTPADEISAHSVHPEETVIPLAIGPVLSVALHRFDSGKSPGSDHGVSEDLITYHHPHHPVSREYREIWQQLRASYLEPAPRMLLLTAAAAASGTSIFTANLAIVAARETESKVLIIDGNFLRPGVSRRFGLQESPGLADVLDQTVPLAWAIQSTPIPQVQALTAGQELPQRPASLAELPKLLSQLRHWFPWIFVDAGVWSESIAGEVMAAPSDGAYFVTRSDRVNDEEFVSLREIVSDAGGHPRGYITTRE